MLNLQLEWHLTLHSLHIITVSGNEDQFGLVHGYKIIYFFYRALNVLLNFFKCHEVFNTFHYSKEIIFFAGDLVNKPIKNHLKIQVLFKKYFIGQHTQKRIYNHSLRQDKELDKKRFRVN